MAVLARLRMVHRKWADRFGPTVQLMPTAAATTLRKSDGMVLDGPYAETREQLLGFYAIDVENLQAGLGPLGQGARSRDKVQLRKAGLGLRWVLLPERLVDLLGRRVLGQNSVCPPQEG
ncbi:hypothetical protein GI374_17770 [Paracoccus sp. S-4012]|uniref:YciI family protein n=1 Tax=Paracoccus sp. S-4012 TaxID=2665648 RepID=UPI0012AF94A1|nr:hypothetical protein [Paracoccus sp. S-4012]